LEKSLKENENSIEQNQKYFDSKLAELEDHRRYEDKLEASLAEYDEFIRIEKMKYDN
jgi:hypothetical protein